MPAYTYNGPTDCTTNIDTSVLKGKVAIVTGGSNGLGEAYVRALSAAGAHVCIGDINDKAGAQLAQDIPNAKFVHCDVTNWDDQVSMIREAANMSPSGKISYVVANAGMIKKDTVYHVNETEPTKPDLQTLDVNITGSMYTVKLALHYFVKQNGTVVSPEQEDTCLVLIGSGASYFDGPRNPQYAATKWGMRGVMHSLRQTAHHHGSRVNMISPWYVKTSIMSEEVFQGVKASGVEFATLEDAQQCLLRILSDTGMNGKSLFIAARKWAAEGYLDLDMDDHKNALMEEIQADQVRSAPVEAGLFID